MFIFVSSLTVGTIYNSRQEAYDNYLLEKIKFDKAKSFTPNIKIVNSGGKFMYTGERCYICFDYTTPTINVSECEHVSCEYDDEMKRSFVKDTVDNNIKKYYMPKFKVSDYKDINIIDTKMEGRTITIK